MGEFINSKKVKMTLMGAVIVPVMDLLGCSHESLYAVCGLVGTYVGGQSVVDHAKEKTKNGGNEK